MQEASTEPGCRCPGLWSTVQESQCLEHKAPFALDFFFFALILFSIGCVIKGLSFPSHFWEMTLAFGTSELGISCCPRIRGWGWCPMAATPAGILKGIGERRDKQ